MHDLGLALIAAGLASLATWHVGYRSGIADERARISRHVVQQQKRMAAAADRLGRDSKARLDASLAQLEREIQRQREAS